MVTIKPLAQGTPQSAPVECQLTEYCLNDHHFTPAYRKYLDDTAALGGLDDPQRRLHRRTPGHGLGDWIQIARFGDNVEINQPESRYIWGDYLALSYTWGNPADQREIIVNGQPLLITQNLEACLRVLRSKQYTQYGWKFWIDAICINQKNIVERAGQVKRMREIYTRAWTPIIWLGKQDESSDDALDLLMILASEYSSRDGVSKLTSTLHRNAQHFGIGCWRALHGLICRPYWRRLWILQEIALGRYSTPVLCGERTLCWGQFARAFKTLSNTDEIINIYIDNELRAASLSLDLAIWPNLATVEEIQFHQDSDVDGKPIDIHRLLHYSREVFSTDPRDKVYGLLGLLDERIAALVKPDYTDTVENVYRSFTLAILEATGSLDVIRHCASSESSNFPSWVPDLAIAQKNAPLTLRSNSFATSDSSLASFQLLPDSHLLSCKGFITDHIDGMGCMWSKGWAPESVLQTQGTMNPYETFEEARDAIWKTMVVNHSHPSEYLEADYGSLLATPVLAGANLADQSPLKDLIGSFIFDWCVQSLKGNTDFKIAGKKMEEYFWKEARPEEVDAIHLRHALMQRDRINLSRRLITTERGYVGMAPETGERGDVVAVLLGCSVPIVLRELKNDGNGDVRWRIVGECYVHGIMNGEAMRWNIDEQDIVLC